MNTPKSQVEEFPFLPALVLLGAFCLVAALLLAAQPKADVEQVAVVPTEAPTLTPEPTEAPTEVAVAAAYDADTVAHGASVYAGICSACHAPNARGIPGLGKDLIASEFVHGLSDDELLQFIIVGRQPWDEGNTTGVAMPARGGNPALSDDDIRSVIAFIRTETDNAGLGGAVVSQPTSAAEVVGNPTTVSATVTPAPTAAPINVPSEDTVVNLPPVAPRDGATSYAQLCAGCHGANGEGSLNNGSAINDSDLLSDDEAYSDFLTAIEPIAPNQGFVHPVRGGYPPLTDEEIQPLIDYVHELAEAE